MPLPPRPLPDPIERAAFAQSFRRSYDAPSPSPLEVELAIRALDPDVERCESWRRENERVRTREMLKQMALGVFYGACLVAFFAAVYWLTEVLP